MRCGRRASHFRDCRGGQPVRAGPRARPHAPQQELHGATWGVGRSGAVCGAGADFPLHPRRLGSRQLRWIAQRDGRAKDGFDRTEPALLKMFLLAWRGECPSFGDWLRRVSLVPVSVSYELDPCAATKAKELYHLARDGSYEKPPGEDHASMVQGIFGFKGRTHVAFGEPVTGDFETADGLAEHLDAAIVATSSRTRPRCWRSMAPLSLNRGLSVRSRTPWRPVRRSTGSSSCSNTPTNCATSAHWSEEAGGGEGGEG